MKYSVKRVKKEVFQPHEVRIVVENQEELASLMLRLDLNYNELHDARKNSKLLQLFSYEDDRIFDELSSELHDVFDENCK